jgi:peptidoglycan/LPS O-acetylase OafA/YrhL
MPENSKKRCLREITLMQQLTSDRLAQVSQSYRPDIDGLRAVAVLAVVLCHAGFAQFSGGFTGVDVFFTISGFVVANSILSDLRRDAFSFKAFYARRAKRLMPALYLMLAATFVFSVLFCFPEDTFQLGKNILAVSTMTSNIFLSKQTGYFDTKAVDQPLLHTWSLSVEEQFYIVLPLLLFWLHKKSKRWVFIGLASLAVISFAYATLEAQHGSAGAYYFAQNRAFEFLLGVLLALFEFKRKASTGARFDLLFVAGLVIILAGVLGLSHESQFPGLGALLPCGGAILTIFAGRRAAKAGAILSNAPAVFIGRISYPLYLWHWPIFFALRRFDLATPTTYLFAMGVAVLLSTLTYFVVERRVQLLRISAARALVWFLVVPLLSTGVLAGTGKLTDGFLFAYPAKIRANVHWSGTALFDMPRAKQCWSQVAVTDESTCLLGDATAKDRAVLWGDSHAYHLIYFFDKLGKARKMAIHDLAFTLCPPIENEPPRASDTTLMQSHLQCVQHDRVVMDYVMSRSDIKTVFVASAWQNYQNLASGANPQPNGHGFMPGQLENELGNTIGKLTAAGKHVVVLNDVPMIPTNLINCDFYNELYLPFHRQTCTFDASIAHAQHEPVRDMLKRLKTHYPQIDIMHTYDVPCADGVCQLDFNGLPIYRYNDYHHLSLAGSSLYYSEYLAKHPNELNTIFGGKIKRVADSQ